MVTPKDAWEPYSEIRHKAVSSRWMRIGSAGSPHLVSRDRFAVRSVSWICSWPVAVAQNSHAAIAAASYAGGVSRRVTVFHESRYIYVQMNIAKGEAVYG
jgi:hypothetical protein